MPSDSYRGLTDPAFATMDWAERPRYFRLKLLERDGGVCQLCGAALTLEDMDADHIVPVAVGGPTHWDNLRATHATCNRRRWLGEYSGDRVRGSNGRRSDGVKRLALLRIPPDVDAALCEWAAEEDRSVNSLMVHLLRLAIRNRSQSQ